MTENTTSKIKTYLNCCLILHNLVTRLEEQDIEKEQLLQELEETALTMETLASGSKFLSDDDESSAIDDMPAEIKNWLASTFTTAPQIVRKTERPRFKAVANAILAMLMVEKIFKKSTESAAMNIPSAVSKMMENTINEWDFDVMQLDELSDSHALKYLTVYLFLNHNILRKYKISSDLLEEFLDEIEIGYSRNNNPFFNALHACDVLQTVHFFIHSFSLKNWLTDLQIFVFLFSAVIHYYDDPGVSNAFLIKTNSQLSLIYNDTQVRENHHVSSVFRLLQNPKCNFIRGLNKNEYSEFRKMTIECVLNADLSLHAHHLKLVKAELVSGTETDKMKIVEFLFHTADISHPAKLWSFHSKWVEMWQEQMFKQGDLEYEMNIPYSPMCSRDINSTADLQTNLLLYIIEPTFQLVGQVLEFIKPQVTFSKTASDVSAIPALTKHHSGNTQNKSYPWANRITLNKSMWLRMSAARTKYSTNQSATT